MKIKDLKLAGRKDFFEKTFHDLAARKRAPLPIYFLLLLIYVVASIGLHMTKVSDGVILLKGGVLPIASLTGVFSSLANISIILIVVLFGKFGYITTLVICVGQFPSLINYIVVHKSYVNLPGFFSNIFTILATTFLYINNRQIEKYQTQLRDQAVTDSLTQLPNRVACNDMIGRLIKKNDKFAVVMIDLNNFKTINDTVGHNVGNEVLKEIATRWKLALESDLSGTLDFITRQGGDEFILIIRDYKTEEDIIKSIGYYESVLEKKIMIMDHDYYITASFGYVEYPIDADNADTLISYADAAMYKIKHQNTSNHILRFNPDMLLDGENEVAVERKIRNALALNAVYYVLQPQYDIDHNLRGFEALARMKDLDGTVINPGVFIPVAEKVGLIDKIDSFVLKKAGKFFGELVAKTGTKASLGVNVSVRHLIREGFVNEVKQVLKDFKIPAEQLEIEITESIMINPEERALDCIKKLKEMGIKIAIDDFGTGYSSLSYLNKIPADLLKIDKSFIDEMNTNDSSKQYVATIISIGHIMKFDVISEGVEEHDQLDTLKDIGCDLIQGFIWGQPMSPEEAEKLV